MAVRKSREAPWRFCLEPPVGTSDWPPAEAQDKVAAWVPTPHPTPRTGVAPVSLGLFLCTCVPMCVRT